MIADLNRRIGSRVRTVGELFTVEAPLLAPLRCAVRDRPMAFPAGGSAQSGHGAHQPVFGAGPAGRPPSPVQLHASYLEVYCDRQLVATHERLPGKAQTRLELDHYLEILLRKPGAPPGSTALEQARAAGGSPRCMTPGGPRRVRPMAMPRVPVS